MDIDRLIIHICLNCNYNDGDTLHIQKDHLRSAIASWQKEVDTSKGKLVAALTNALETHHNLELANNPSYPATSVYIATKVALEAALKEAE